jgi:type I restriction enzyme S subunit
MSRTASVGYVTILGKPMATSQDFVTWTCSDALLPEYLMYALMAEGKGIRRFGRGSTHTTIYFPELRAFHIALPPLKEQHIIVSKTRRLLDRADILAAEAARSMLVAERLAARAVRHAMEGRLPTAASGDGTARNLLAAIRADREVFSVPESRVRREAVTEHVVEASMKPDEPPMGHEELTAAIKRAGGRMRADELWRLSRLEIEAFYRELRTEVRAGHIVQDADREHLVAN